MIRVNKYKDEFGDQIKLEFNDGQVLNINYGGNLDLYISSFSKDDFSCNITFEDYDLYNIFDKLYNNIINFRPYGNEYIDKNFKYENDISSFPLVKDKEIYFYSDDEPVNMASLLKITKENDKINITIKGGTYLEGFENHSVRIRTNGSRYSSFFVPFMNMYNEINETDFDVHQITMDEYAKSLKLRR